MSNYIYNSEESNTKELSFERTNEGEVNFIVSSNSGFNDSTGFETLNRYFDHEYLNTNAIDIENKGGRGQTLLGRLPYKSMALLYGPIRDLALDESNNKDSANVKTYGLCLRHYYRGGLVGKFIKDGFWRFDKWACRARLEFELLAKLHDLGLPVPRPLIAREQVGSLFITNDIVVERIDKTVNLAELLERQANIDEDIIDIIARTIVKFAKHNVVHTDLNIRNILINDEKQCFIVDFDKCLIKENFNKEDLISMLNRLERSFNKTKEQLNLEKLDIKSLCERLQKTALSEYEIF